MEAFLGGTVIVLGLSGLPRAQEHLRRPHPDLFPLDGRIRHRLAVRPDPRRTHLGETDDRLGPEGHVVAGTGVATSA